MILKTKCGRRRAAVYIAMGGQITHKPRNFVNRIDDIWVKSLYNEKNVVYLSSGMIVRRASRKGNSHGRRPK